MTTTYNDVTPLAPRLVTIAEHSIESSAAFLEAKKGTSDEILSAIDLFNRLKVMAEEMQRREEAIMVNERLSPVGRREEAAALCKEFTGRFSFVRDGAESRKRAATDLRDRLLATPKPSGNDTLDYMVSTEIRSRLAPLPQAERMKILNASLRSGDTRILRALELDPLHETLIEPEYLQRLKEERAQKHENGKDWLKLQSLMFVAERLEQLATVIDLQLSHYNEVPSFDPKTTTRQSEMVFVDNSQVPDKGPADKPTREQFH